VPAAIVSETDRSAHAPWDGKIAPHAGGAIDEISEKGGAAEERQEMQRPGICASGDCPIWLITGSHPSGSRGLGVGAGALISTGPFTALRLFVVATGMRSPLSVRFTIGALWLSEGAAVVAETSRPARKDATAKAAPPQPTTNRE
jgi:hypothetical protein